MAVRKVRSGVDQRACVGSSKSPVSRESFGQLLHVKTTAYQKCRPEQLTEMSDTLREKYGGAEGFLTTQCGFSDQDVTIIKRNLRTRVN